MRSSIYYCDPMRSGQKGGIEQAHNMLRMILPKKTSFEYLTQWDLRTIVAVSYTHLDVYKRQSQNFVKISFCCHNYHLTNHNKRKCFLKCTSCHSISVRAFSTKTYLYLCFSFVIALLLALVKHVC